MDKDTMTIIGCDLGDRSSHLCLLDPEGSVLRRAKIGTTKKAFDKFFAGLERSLVVLEVGTHSRWSSALLHELGHQCVVANPRHVRLIYGGTHKNDRLDAEALARLGRLDPTLLRPIEHRGQEAQTELSVLKARDTLVRQRTRLVAAVRGMAKSTGVRLVACDADYFARKVTLPPPLQPALGPMLQSIEELTGHIKHYDKQIAELCAQHPETHLFQQVPGVGPITALAYALTLEHPERFARSRQAAAFVGLVPKQRQSGRHDPQLGITKAGDRFLRRLLVQCAHCILSARGQDSDLRRFGLRLAAQGGKRAKKRAVVAVARKLAVLLHRLWVSGELYEPFRLAPEHSHAA
ncbi:MAG: IS110 family transposase [Polyangiales bacterium]